MNKRNRRKKYSLKSFLQINKLLLNVSIIVSSTIVLGFIWSFINNFNKDNKINYDKSAELEKLLIINEFEEKTGHRIRLEVLNGCGIGGLADKYSNLFRGNGFDVILSKNANNFEYDKSQVILRRGEKNMAIEVAKLLDIPIEEIIKNYDLLLDCDVTIILGKDYNKLSSFNKAIEISPPY